MRRLALYRRGAAAGEEAVLFDELEGVHGPVLAFGFDDVGVGEEEDGFLCAGAVVADDEIRFFRGCPADKDVGIGESGGFEASGGGFGYGGGGAGGEAGLDFDELLIYGSGEL